MDFDNIDNIDSNDNFDNNDNFDDLQNLWQTQKIDPNIFNTQKTKDMINQIENQREKILKQNIFVTVSMIPVYITMIWIFNSFPERGLLFKGSIIFMVGLISVMLVIFWSRLTKWKKSEVLENNNTYVQQSIKKLKFQKTLTNVVTPLYIVLLAAALNIYFLDIFNDSPFGFRMLAHLTMTVPMFLVSFIKVLKENKKFDKEVQPLIDDLEKIKSDF